MNRRQFLKASTGIAASIAIAGAASDCEASSMGVLNVFTRIPNHRLGYAPGASVEIVRNGQTFGPFRTDSAGRFSITMIGLPAFKVKVFYYDGRRYYGEQSTSFSGRGVNITVSLRRL